MMINKFLTVIFLAFSLFNTISTGTITTINTPVENLMYGNHAPIRIVGDNDFLSENGVTGGTGTVEDPFLIENWIIISDGSSSQGIFISNTTVYFIIRNCTISGFHSLPEFGQGIKFSGVINGRIEDTKVRDCETGIYILVSSHDEIFNCTCYDHPFTNGYGILLYQSINISIVSSKCYNVYDGIEILESSDIMVQKTQCYNNTSFGLFSNNIPRHPIMRFLIEDCTFQNNKDDGIHLSGSTLPHSSGSIIRNCSFYSNGLEPIPNLYRMGMYLERLWNTIIENCIFDHNGFGLYIGDRSKNVIIRNCSFLNNVADGVQIKGDPLFLSFSPKAEISYCDFIKNDCGLFLYYVRRAQIHHCVFENNSYFGILSVFSTSSITSNNILNNGRNYPAIDSSGAFIWSSFSDLRNNWWGTTQGPSISIGVRTGMIIPIRSIENSDVVLFLRGFALVRPWEPAPVSDAG
jgi:parallel beta-helix repeat protein